MAKARTTKKRLEIIEKDLGDVKKQVTNDIPHTLEELKETDGFIYKQVCENKDISIETRDAVTTIINNLLKYTPFAGPAGKSE